MNQVSLRPRRFEQFVGQKRIIENLKVFIEASQMRGESLDHCLLFGPAGLGKTSLAHLMSHEMGVDLIALSSLGIEHMGDLLAVISDLKAKDILFIDEIHRLSKPLQESLYTIMEDGYIDIVVGEQEMARAVRLDFEPFTLVGASTDISNLSSPFLDRFGIHLQFDYYQDEEIQEILMQNSEIMMCKIVTDGIIELSKRSRGIPRLANRYLKRIRDFANVEKSEIISKDLVLRAFDLLNVDDLGLLWQDLEYLRVLITQFNNGPVGVSSLASVLHTDISVLENSIEPYLMQIGLIQRTSRGRIACAKAQKHLALTSLDKEI